MIGGAAMRKDSNKKEQPNDYSQKVSKKGMKKQKYSEISIEEGYLVIDGIKTGLRPDFGYSERLTKGQLIIQKKSA